MEGPRLFGKPMRGGDAINQRLEFEQLGGAVGNAEPDDLGPSRTRKAARAVKLHRKRRNLAASRSHRWEGGVKPRREDVTKKFQSDMDLFHRNPTRFGERGRLTEEFLNLRNRADQKWGKR